METVEDLRNKLISLGMTKDEVDSIKGKGALRDMVENLEALNKAEVSEESNVGLIEEKCTGQSQAVEQIPDYNSSDWEPYVMSKFSPSELVDGKHPKLPGLRRVAGLLLGEIVFSAPTSVNLVLLPDAPGRASVTYTVKIAWKLGQPSYSDLVSEVREFSALGGSWHGNTDDLFAVFPEAIAEARAEARAFRKALQLSVTGADELTRKDTAEITRNTVEKVVVMDQDTPNKKITSSQISAIKNICNRLGIDVEKFINMGSKQYGSIEDILSDTAAKMITQLSRYQSNGEDSQPIPDGIKKV